MSDAVMPETDVQYEVWQGDYLVASSDALSDAQHYMAVYGQDGLVEAKTAVTTRFPGFSALAAPPPPSVSTDNGPRPQEAVPTCDAKPAVVAHSTYLSAVAGRMAFRDAYRRCLPVVQAAEALAAKWTREGQKVDSDDFYAAINDVWEAVAKRNGDPLAKDDGAYAATPQPADGCSSNEGVG